MIVQRHARLGSTNDEALRQARDGAPGGTVVVAARQDAGRGRQGRNWASPPGNLHASFLLRPAVPPARAAEIGFVAALAVAGALDGFVPGARLKWPNDVLLGGAKVAGILSERVDAAVVVGIGVNVAHAPPAMPYPVASLAGHGATATVDAVLAALVAQMEQGLARWEANGFAAVRDAWLQRGPALGQALQARLGARTLAGSFAGLDVDGALLLDTPGGRRRVVAGDVAEGLPQQVGWGVAPCPTKGRGPLETL